MALSAGTRDASVIVDLSVIDAAAPQAEPGNLADGQHRQLLLPGPGQPVSRLYVPSAAAPAAGGPGSGYGSAGALHGRLVIPPPRTHDPAFDRPVALTPPGSNGGAPRTLAAATAMPRPSPKSHSAATQKSSSALFPPPQGFAKRPIAAQAPLWPTPSAPAATRFAVYPPPEPLTVAASEPAASATAKPAPSRWAFSPARRPKPVQADEAGASSAQRAAVLAPVVPAGKPDRAAKLAMVSPVKKAGGQERLRLIYAANQVEMPAPLRREMEPVVQDLRADRELRVQLAAYAGGPGDTISRARRTSLSRALSIRRFLIENGIKASRIDVRALGNKSGASAPERVDVEVIGK